MDIVVPLRRPERVTRPEPLWREAVGAELRRERLAAGRTLGDVAERAGLSVQYLSEMERGLKDPSSVRSPGPSASTCSTSPCG